MTEHRTLTWYLERNAKRDPLRAATVEAVRAFCSASIEISDLIGQGALAGVSGKNVGLENADGDDQKDLDVKCDSIIRRHLASVHYGAVISEECVLAESADDEAPISIAYDPLDGSSNIETNMTVGTIFSILPNTPGLQPFTGPGTEQLAAGFVVYGPQTSLILTLGDGVDIFTLDRKSRIYKLVRDRVQIPVDCAEYAINASNVRHWEPPVQEFIRACTAGMEGPLRKDFNMRWIASLVAETYRILIRGGIFLYPSDARKKYANGRLRLLYEAHPMAFIVEQAGGKSIDWSLINPRLGAPEASTNELRSSWVPRTLFDMWNGFTITENVLQVLLSEPGP